MIVTEECLKQAKDKYYEVRRLLDEESKKDPVNAPYKSKYEARKLLQSIESDLNVCCNNETGEHVPSKAVLVSSLVDYELAVISFEIEELAEVEDLLRKCLSKLKGHETTPECCIISVSALNQLGILWSGRSELQKACKYLKEAENIYIQYRKIVPFVSPLDPSDFLEENSCTNKGRNAFEKAHTHTLYYLAQVYKNLEENETSAAYCQITLKRQLESKEYDPIEWSLNCATLSQYLVAKDNLTVGRHFLASAQYVLTCYETELLEKHERSEEKYDKIKNCKASVARCWIEYGLLILHLSQQELLLKASFEGEDYDKGGNEKKDQPKSDKSGQSYTLLALPGVKDIEQKITDKLVLDFEQARSVFLCVQNWIKIAKEYFGLDGHTTDHVHIIQEYSRLYKLLAFFEHDADRQCKMHKRRNDILEEVLKQLNLQYYLLISRQLMFEIAETYSEMMDIKYEIMDKNKDNVTSHAMKKINALACKCIQHFQKFIDTLKGSDNKLPETFSDDVVRPALVAHFCIGRIFSKICAEPREKLENLRKTEKYYKYIIKYVDRNPSHFDAVRNELPLIKEMVQLMPGKMQSIIGNTMY